MTEQPTRPQLPPGIALYRLAIAHYASRALALFAKLGIADRLEGGPASAEQLASATQTHAPALRRVLRLLATHDIVDEREDGSFALTALGGQLRSDAPSSLRAMVSVFAGEGMQDTWKELEYCVRSGLPAFKKHDPNADPFTKMAADPEAAATFDKAMATFAPQTAAAVAKAYDFSAFDTVVDVGGGNGALLIGILRANAKLRGTVFDQPHVGERTRREVHDAELADRLSVVSGSFFAEVPAGADAYLLKHVIHDWNDDDARAILAVCRKAMPALGKLLLVEGVYPARIDRSFEAAGAAANDVNMLVITGGRQRSESEFRQLYAAAGFELTRIVPTAGGVSVIEGVPR